ncbi:hypothetical protein ACIRH0_03955 [Streptomyces sp. NPDC093675]|uniref:hypothetical protein n=1 Tax=Streptomyces sp. NPDC093675 TaxID=3366049 RepID=UPI0038305FD0
MGLGRIARSLVPGKDRELAQDLAAEKRARRSRSADAADRRGQRWEDGDRARDRKGGVRHTTWE